MPEYIQVILEDIGTYTVLSFKRSMTRWAELYSLTKNFGGN